MSVGDSSVSSSVAPHALPQGWELACRSGFSRSILKLTDNLCTKPAHPTVVQAEGGFE